MRVALDGGALCSKSQFGNYRFTTELLTAISQYDHENEYALFSFCYLDNHYGKQITPVKLTPSLAWMKVRVPLELHRSKYDVFIAANQALPAYDNTRTIAISHGLSFLRYPEYYQSEYGRLYGQLQDYCLRSDHIFVSSEREKRELIASQIPIRGQVHAIPFGVPYLFRHYRSYRRKNWILYVGSDQPVKQVNKLVAAFRASKEAGWKLILCGVSARYREKDIIVIEQVSVEQLLHLYRQSRVYVSVSAYESFNYPIIEALSQRCPVLALDSAVIPEQQSLVTVSSTMSGFQALLAEVMRGTTKLPPPDDRVKEVFNWKRYVLKLRQLY